MRIRCDRGGGPLVGPPATAIGYLVDAPPIAIGGAVLTLVGAIGQLAYVIDARRRRGPFTSEHDWRRVAVWRLMAGTAWYAAAPAVVVLEELVGSWTHLVPSVTPGDVGAHAAQRKVLAAASRSRLVAWNAGVALAWSGLALEAAPVAAAGAAVVIGTLGLSVALLVRALALGRY